MFTIDSETYHIINLVPAAAGMYAKVDDFTYELVVLWAHCQKNKASDDDDTIYAIGVDCIIGVTIVDLEHGTFAAHEEYTTNPPRDDKRIQLKR